MNKRIAMPAAGLLLGFSSVHAADMMGVTVAATPGMVPDSMKEQVVETTVDKGAEMAKQKVKGDSGTPAGMMEHAGKAVSGDVTGAAQGMAVDSAKGKATDMAVDKAAEMAKEHGTKLVK